MKWLPILSVVIVIVLAITDLEAGLAIIGFLVLFGAALFLFARLFRSGG